MSTALFPAGKIAITPEARKVLDPRDIVSALKRHKVGDWTEMSETIKTGNDARVGQGGLLVSGHRDRYGVKFWIATKSDRSTTTVLLPDV